MGQNVGVRRLLIGLVAALTSLVVAAVGVDFGTAIYAEYRWARSLRTANDLGFDPWVGVLGFPFVTQALDHEYGEVEVRAGGVDHPVVGKASLETTLHDVDLAKSSWLIGPEATLPIGKIESRIIVDSTHLGRYMGIKDLLVFTGTPTASGFEEKVSISVDLTMVGEDQTTVLLTPTGVLTGPGTADEEVPDDELAAVLAAFSASIPGLKLPFGIAPTSGGARGIAEGVTVTLDGFDQT